MANSSDAVALLTELKARGIFNEITDEAKFKNLAKGTGVYIGFDPSATSLHLGNYIQITMLRRFASYGFNAIAVIGGATGMIGDPSGRVSERQLLDKAVLARNIKAITRQLEHYGLSVVDNASWYQGMSILDFLREVGKHVNVSYMLAKESVKTRLEAGLSFTEFTYQLLQGWDFKVLYTTHDVKVQLGGSDQWGNITTGIELIRKFHGDQHEGVGLTVPLLTTSKGEKFGKSANNAVWIDPKLTSPFALYQFLFKTPDSDIDHLLRWLTFTPLKELEALSLTHHANPGAQAAQRFFAHQVTSDIHGERAAKEAEALTQALYNHALTWPLRKSVISNLKNAVPTFFNIEGPILKVLVEVGLATSQREARDLISSGGVYLNNESLSLTSIVKAPLTSGAHLLRKGKRTFALIIYDAPQA